MRSAKLPEARLSARSSLHACNKPGCRLSIGVLALLASVLRPLVINAGMWGSFGLLLLLAKMSS